MSRFGAVIALATAMGAALWPWPSAAQEPFPSRTVKIVVPAAPGSTTDTLARIVADQLGQKWGKTAIVENVPGGAMNIGAGNVARAAPDGYTLLVAPPSPLSFNHMLFRDLGYEPTKFVADHHAGENPQRSGGSQGSSGNDVEGASSTTARPIPASSPMPRKAWAPPRTCRRRSSKCRPASRWCTCPIAAHSPALTDVVAGHVDMFFDTLATSVPLYRENKVKLLGVADLQRAGVIPDVPTFSGSGAAGLQVDHLVRIGRATGHARRPGGEDQPRRRRNPQEQGGRRHAAPDLARGGSDDARRHRAILCRRDGPVDQGDQGSGDRAAITA